MLRLVATYGEAEQVFSIPEREARLGSAAENDIVLRAQGVSRRHALVRRCAQGVEFLDRKSKNGLLVEGQRVESAVLTPGLRIQVGAAWLTVEEVSSAEETLALLSQISSERSGSPPLVTEAAKPERDPRELSPDEAALALAFHVAERGVGTPGERADLLVRIRATLGGEFLGAFERSRRGKLHLLEHEGHFTAREVESFAQLAGEVRPSDRGHVVLKRVGRLVLAGRESWFLGVKFADESLAKDGWRKEFLRFLADRFFLPVRRLEDLDSLEAGRVLALARGKKRRAAELLGVSPGTLYKLLRRRTAAKPGEGD